MTLNYIVTLHLWKSAKIDLLKNTSTAKTVWKNPEWKQRTVTDSVSSAIGSIKMTISKDVYKTILIVPLIKDF